MPIALITGATAGIGEATARVFAQQGFSLVLTGRRQERLDALQQELSTHCPVHTLRFDVRDQPATQAAIEGLPEAFKPIDILINNAGNAHGLAPIEKGDLNDWEAMIDINLKGLLYVTRAVLPQMTARKSGHIINIGSIAGKEAYANGNVYCASKSAVDALSQAMRIDLNPYGIRVGAVNPGLVETEFSMVRFKGDSERAKQVYTGMQALSGHDIAEILLFAVTRPPHVNIADLLVLPTAQATATLVKRANT